MLAQNAEFVRKPTPGLPTAKRWDGCTGNWGRRRPHGRRANKQSVGCSPTTRVKLELVSHLSFPIREGHPRAPPPSARRLRAAEGVGQGTPGGLRCPGRWPHFPQQDEEEEEEEEWKATEPSGRSRPASRCPCLPAQRPLCPETPGWETEQWAAIPAAQRPTRRHHHPTAAPHSHAAPPGSRRPRDVVLP